MNQNTYKQSHQTPQRRQIHQSTSLAPIRQPGSSPRRTCPTSSGRSAKRSASLNLFSIISKFEALDAVSLPYRYPGLQPAPLQVSRNSSRRRDGYGGGMERLSTIFSPGSKGYEGYEGYIPLGSEENLRPTSGRHEPTVNTEECTPNSGIKRWRERPRKSVSPQKSKIPMSSRGDRRSRSDSDLKDTCHLLSSAQTRLENEGSKRHRSIKEMIKFYDGATSTRHNTKTKTSFADSSISETPVSMLLSPMVTNDKRNGTVRRKTLTKPSSIYVTSTGSPHTTGGRRQSHAFGFRSRESFSTQFMSSKWSTTRPRSPSRTRRQSSFRGTPDTSSKRSSFRGRSLPRIVVKNQPSEGHTNGNPFRTPTRQQHKQPLGPPRSGNGSQMSSSKAKIGNKIEALYRAKSMEREKKDTSERVPKTPISKIPIKASPWQSSGRTRTTTQGGPDISPSRVAEMKRLFERQQGDEQQSQITPLNSSKLTKLNMSASPQISPKSQAHLPQAPPPVLDLGKTRTPAVSPITVLKKEPPVQSPRTSVVISPKFENKLELPSPQRARNKTLGDRIKLFEEGVRPKEKDARLKKRSFSGKCGNPIIASRKSFFEIPGWKNAGRSKFQEKVDLNAKDIEAIVEEVNDGAGGSKSGKRKNLVGKWNAFSHESNSTHTSKHGKENDETKALLTRTSEELERMVVKEAECGLKEPKPMRLVEMKRMMLLCREKAGFGADRDKMRVGGQFKKL